MSSEPEACANCRFWHELRDPIHFADVNGRCRRYAPQGFTPSGVGGSLFPPMNSSQWCGDYERRPAEVITLAKQDTAAA